jgi:hypothetical protein
VDERCVLSSAGSGSALIGVVSGESKVVVVAGSDVRGCLEGVEAARPS